MNLGGLPAVSRAIFRRMALDPAIDQAPGVFVVFCHVTRADTAANNVAAHINFSVLSRACIACCLIQLSMSALENRQLPPTLKAGICLAAANLQIVRSVTFR
jgi:hypothetical protein